MSKSIVLYENWCYQRTAKKGKKTLWHLTERKGARKIILEELSDRVLDHYIADEEIAEFFTALEFPKAAECIRTLLPTAPKSKSGDLGEILASEFIKERLEFEVPVKKLRYKDHREMAMRGEDVIGIAYDNKNQLELLKCEAKSAQRLSRETVNDARNTLEKDHGRPSAHSLIFIARQLIQCGDPHMKEMGVDLLEEATDREVPKSRLAHLMFTLSGSLVTKIFKDDLDAADGAREQHSVSLRIEDHPGFIKTVFDKAGSFGDG